MPFKSNSQIRWNNAVPEPSMYSVYFSSESAGDRASSRRSSCLRSSNRSVRKSFPSQVNRSNAKKHGGSASHPPWRGVGFVISGSVRDTSGSPVSGARILLGTEVVLSNDAGAVMLRRKRPGSVTVRVDLDQFQQPGK